MSIIGHKKLKLDKVELALTVLPPLTSNVMEVSDNTR